MARALYRRDLRDWILLAVRFAQHPRVHLLMTSTVAILIASMLVLLFELQYPFRSSVGVKADTWYGFLEHVQLMQSGSQHNMRM